MLKDEAGAKQIIQFVGLRAKLNSYNIFDGSEDKKCKNDTKRSIQFDDYLECLFTRKEQHRKMNVIRNHCHKIYTEKLIKLPSLLTMTNELLWLTEYTLWLMDI